MTRKFRQNEGVKKSPCKLRTLDPLIIQEFANTFSEQYILSEFRSV